LGAVETLPMSPTMAVGVSDRLWDMSDIVALIDAIAVPAKKRSPYKKRETSNSK